MKIFLIITMLILIALDLVVIGLEVYLWYLKRKIREYKLEQMKGRVLHEQE